MNFDSKKTNEASGVLLRSKSLFYDWLFICAYLFFLFIITVAFYLLVLRGIPKFTNIQSQFITTLTSVVPITIIFSIMEGSIDYATCGKKKSKLRVIYKDSPMKRSFIRNVIKFLPWQLGHMSTINGIYNGFDTPFSMVFFILSMALTISYILMVFIRKDNRHLGDFVAGSKVIKNY